MNFFTALWAVAAVAMTATGVDGKLGGIHRRLQARSGCVMDGARYLIEDIGVWCRDQTLVENVCAIVVCQAVSQVDRRKLEENKAVRIRELKETRRLDELVFRVNPRVATMNPNGFHQHVPIEVAGLETVAGYSKDEGIYLAIESDIMQAMYKDITTDYQNHAGEGAFVETIGFLMLGDYKLSITNLDGPGGEILAGPIDIKIIEPPTNEIKRNSAATATEDAAATDDAVDDDDDDDDAMVTEDSYGGGGHILESSGRLYYDSKGVTYSCTGTVIKDNTSGRTLILTAAHCVWDDIDKTFGSDVLFIPQRDDINVENLGNLTVADIHRSCNRDICGCWAVSGGVASAKFHDTQWPDRLAYDYGFYIVDDVHGRNEMKHGYDVDFLEGVNGNCGSDALDEAVVPMEFGIGIDVEGEFIHAFGYSLEYNPDFRYCAENSMTREPSPAFTSHWLDNCALSGGSSGGPWVTNFADGTGTVVSVSSWAYGDRDGYGAPIIDESLAHCLLNAADEADLSEMADKEEGQQGSIINCEETEAPTDAPLPTYAPSGEEPPTDKTGPDGPGTYGDPHFKTWKGGKFDFHGGCDLILLHNPHFANGLGLDIHIRTKINTWWSFIEAAVIRVGDHTLEVMGGKEGSTWWLDGQQNGGEFGDGKEVALGGFPLKMKKIKEYQIRFRLDFGRGDAISVETYKAFVRVNVSPWRGKAIDSKFAGSTGMLGAYTDGRKVARDMKTVVNDPNEFGQEWQVLDSEPMLFHKADGPQHPTKCAMPMETETSEKRRRRLGQSLINLEDATVACARVREFDRDACIFDVLATNDKDIAGSY